MFRKSYIGLFWVCAFGSILVGCKNAPQIPSAASPQPETRRKEFAAKLSTVKEGMSEERALEILGPPDDICKRSDPLGPLMNNTKAMWLYGTNRHGGPATLGSVLIGQNGNVTHVAGTRGADELVAAVGETRVRDLIRLLNTADVATISGFYYDPKPMIAAIDAVRPLGKRLSISRQFSILSLRAVRITN